MIQKLKRLLGIENYEEALHSFSSSVEQAEMLKAEIDAMAKEYINTSKSLNVWLSQEKEAEAIELIKGQQDGLTSRYLSFLAGKQSEYKRLEGNKKSYIAKYPGFEKALADLKKSDFVDSTLDSYRKGQYTLEECDMIIKAATKEKVQYADNIVFNQNGDILIEQRGPLESYPNLWCLPGGHRKMNEDPCKAAIRELAEETGYDVDECWQIGEFEDDVCHIDYFASMIDTAEQEPVVDANETRHTAFVPVTKLYDYPTMHDIWDKVYEILGIGQNVVKIKKAIVAGFVKSGDMIAAKMDEKVDEMVGGKDKKKKKFKKVMDEWKSGTLKSGGDGSKVTNQKQAIAIALSESGQSKKAIISEIEKAQEEKLQGGKADGKTLEQIAKKHKTDIEDLVKQYKKGLKVESEHSDKEEEAGEIAKDHLWEDAEYYDKLEKIEPEEKAIQPTIQKMIRTKWHEESADLSEFEKGYKYIRKEPDGRGGFNYIYKEEDEKHISNNNKYFLSVLKRTKEKADIALAEYNYEKAKYDLHIFYDSLVFPEIEWEKEAVKNGIMKAEDMKTGRAVFENQINKSIYSLDSDEPAKVAYVLKSLRQTIAYIDDDIPEFRKETEEKLKEQLKDFFYKKNEYCILVTGKKPDLPFEELWEKAELEKEE